jgi:hypothetical protein
MLAPHHIFGRAVEPAFQLGDLPPAGELPRAAHRHHDRFGAGVGEPHALERPDPPDEVPGEAELDLGRAGEAGALLDLSADRLYHAGCPVAMDQNRVIAGEVEQPVPVEVYHPAPVALHQHSGIGRIEDRAAGVTAGEVATELLEPATGGRRAVAVALCFVAHGSSNPSLRTQTFIAK